MFETLNTIWKKIHLSTHLPVLKGSCGKVSVFSEVGSMLTKLILAKALQASSCEGGVYSGLSLLCVEQPAMEFAAQDTEDNVEWYMLKSTIQLRLDFSAIPSYLIILFAMCLQEKK